MSEKNVLIVDDDESILGACVRVVGNLGYNVSSAGSGEEAIEIIKSKQFNLVVTDIQMGKISGLELLKYVKLAQPLCDVIIITGYPSVDSAVESLRMGVHDYIRKPFNINELRDKVQKCLEAQAEHEELNKEKRNEILTTYQISKLCGVTLTTVTNWTDHGILPAYKTPGGHRRIKKEDLIEFLKKYNMPIPDEIK